MAAPGKGESTTENVYSGLCMVAENGVILASDEKENSLAVSEIDIEHMINLRRRKAAAFRRRLSALRLPVGRRA